MKKGITPLTVLQMIKLMAILLMQMARVVRHMPRDDVQYWIGKPSKLKSELQKFLLQSGPINELLFDWQQFYAEVFGREFDPTSVTLSEKREGFGWVIARIPDLTDNRIYEKCKERFTSWRYHDDLDQVVVHNDRTTENGPYVIRVRDGIEADGSYRNISANEAIKRDIKGVTLGERMLLELWYHWKTGNHLDTKSGTICSGSRYHGGRFPRVFWSGVRFKVGYVVPDYADDSWGVREQVS